jgi:glyoxylase-like metal-dependent hydrolase (beta-lactamase superfamily II)
MLRATLSVVMALAAFAVPRVTAQGPPAVKTPRIYIFDNGHIRGLDTQLFGLKREEVKGSTDFVDVSYLIAHPKGTLQFDAGGIEDSHFKGAPVVEGVMTAETPLLPQIAATGYAPGSITYFAMSHYHSDHTANANAFAGATWIVQKAERDYMFGDKPAGIIQPASYAKLRDARTRILNNEDLDVFGDGAVRIVSTPGHTPGHQVLFVRLAAFGPVVLAGDLYHFPEEATLDRVPGFDVDAAQTRASRAKVQALLKQTGAKLWIEHDVATHAPLPKAPKWID